MGNLLSRWASLGVYVVGPVDPNEDPEALLMDTVASLSSDGRLLETGVSWLSRYGHLVLTKKLWFGSIRERRLFSALVEASGTREAKLRRLIVRRRAETVEHLYPDLPEVLKRKVEEEPDPVFLRNGFFLAKGKRVREGIILPPRGAYDRSALLRCRALHGATLRSDVLAVLPNAGSVSLHELSRRLHVAAPSLVPIIRDYVRSGLVERARHRGPEASFKWVGPVHVVRYPDMSGLPGTEEMPLSMKESLNYSIAAEEKGSYHRDDRPRGRKRTKS